MAAEEMGHPTKPHAWPAADSSPRCWKTARMAAASSSDTVNMLESLGQAAWVQQAACRLQRLSHLQPPVAGNLAAAVAGNAQKPRRERGERLGQRRGTGWELLGALAAPCRVAALLGCQPSAQQPSPACIGGHGTDPYEQNTQQSSGFGLKTAPQPVQS